MHSRRSRTVLALALAVAAAAVPAAQDPQASDAESLDRKVTAIVERGAGARPSDAPPVRTLLTEREINAYLKLNAADVMPVGVGGARVTLGEGGDVAGQAVVDLDAVRKSRPRSLLDPMNLVGGHVEIRTAGTLVGANGQGVLTIRTATVGGVPVPVSLLQEVVSFYTRTPESPAGFDLGQPFVLPAGIRSLVVARGVATVVQ